MRHRSGKIKAAFRGAQRFHEYLVSIGVTAGAPDPALLVRPLQRDFERWMSVHRGVRDVTLVNRAPYVSAFLDRLGEDPGRYTAADVRRFILDAGSGPRGHTATTSATASAVRGFLRFLSATGQCDSTLIAAIPRMASWRLATLPSCLPAADVERLIVSCAECPLTARRDRAALLLLWRLALRAGDIANLELRDVDWREARIRIGGKNRREIWLPLAQDVGDALVDYLRNERPDIDCSRLFVKSVAPPGPVDSRTVSWIVRRAIRRTGIVAPAGGAHLIRRSAATNMLRQGATLEQIGSVLRHDSVETTQLYAKVDHELLIDVAAPWPCDHGPLAPALVPDRLTDPLVATGPGAC